MERELRLRYLRMKASQRGLLEAELVLRPFIDRRLPSLSGAELDQFEILIDLPDLDLWEVITGRRSAPPEVSEVLISEIRGFLGARPG
jgi:antitoxin CptB